MNTQDSDHLTDNELVESLPGFANGYAITNDARLHYVAGGQGHPLILLPGWPETWWAYHNVMPLLAERYHVIAVDIRGMGSSAKPADGYDKKTMAADIAELIAQLGYQTAHVAGHDIGADVAFSLAANQPQVVDKLILLDTPHPDSTMYRLPMLPALNQPEGTYPWWVALNQVKQLPEKLLAGRMHLLLDWIFDHLLLNKDAINPHDRAVYTVAYDTPDGIRASNAWYQAFPQDIEDSKTYGKLTMPVLGIGGSGYEILEMALRGQVTDLQLAKIEDSGHFILAEKPQETARQIIRFLG